MSSSRAGPSAGGRRRPASTVYWRMQAEMTGALSSRRGTIPETVVAEIDRNLHGYYSKVERVLEIGTRNPRKSLEACNDLWINMPRQTSTNSPMQNETVNAFLHAGGVQAFCQCLIANESVLLHSSSNVERFLSCLELVSILQNLISASPVGKGVDDLHVPEEFLIVIMKALQNPHAFDICSVFLEEYVCRNVGVNVDLSLSDRMSSLIPSLHIVRMLAFVRLANIVMHDPNDPDIAENIHDLCSDELIARRESMVGKPLKMTDKNIAVLVRVKEFLPRLVRYLMMSREEMLSLANIADLFFLSSDAERTDAVASWRTLGEQRLPELDHDVAWLIGDDEYHDESDMTASGSSRETRRSAAAASGADPSSRASENDNPQSNSMSGFLTRVRDIGRQSVQALANSPADEIRNALSALSRTLRLGGAPGTTQPEAAPAADEDPGADEDNLDITEYAAQVMEQIALLPNVDMLDEEAPRDDEEGDEATRHAEEHRLSTVKLLMTEVIFALYICLSGRMGTSLSHRLARAGLVDGLVNVFDVFDWEKPIPTARPSVPLHGPGCTCTPDSSMLIQFLRLVHMFSELDTDRVYGGGRLKLLFYSREELLARDTPEIFPALWQQRDRNRGLISRLVSSLQRQESVSQSRFWMASCVESFLRGADYRDQMFVAQSGLFESTLVKGTCAEEAEARQSNLDLLSEMIKFNPELCASVTTVLGPSRVPHLLDILVSNVVDSNVLLRSFLLSFERFRELGYRDADRASYKNKTYPFSRCPIYRFIENNRAKLVCDLTTVVAADAISQENVCCINTALFLLLIAEERGSLEGFMDEIREVELSRNRQGVITDHVMALLDFWLRYYRVRDKDAIVLENSTMIPFSRWSSLVKRLVADAPQDRGSLRWRAH